MNPVETVMLVASFFLLAAFLRWRKLPISKALGAAAITLPVCWLCIEYSTQILTCDDSYMFYDVINLRSGGNLIWDGYGALRTTTALTGSLVALAEIAFGFTKDILAVLAKGLHCLWGIALLTIIVDQTYRLYRVSQTYGYYFVVTFCAAAALPVVNLSVHTLNYDLLSMELGALALVWLGAGWRMKSPKLLIACLVAAALAAQEKLIAAPVLWLCTISAAVLFSADQGGSLRSALPRSLKAALVACGIPMLVFLVSFTLVTLVRGGNAPERGLFDALFQPYIFGVWPLLNYSIGAHSITVLYGRYDALWSIAIFSAALAGFSASLILAHRVASRPLCRRLREGLQRTVSARLPRLNFFLLLAICVTGVAATFLLHAKVTPLVAAAPGDYVPFQRWNGVNLFYGASSLAGHLAASAAWACATFVNAFPTIVLSLMLLTWGKRALRKAPHDPAAPVGLHYQDIVAFFTLLAIPLYGVAQIRLTPRYINLFFLLFLVMGGLEMTNWNFRSLKVKTALIGIALALLVIEIVPFRPALVSFRPLWSNPSSAFAATPAFGISPPWHTGWGEEITVAGKRIYRLYAKDCASGGGGIRIFHNYPGFWLRKPPGVELIDIHLGIDACGYNPCDFYLFTRSGTTFSDIPFPSKVAPLLTIDNRGVVKAWVFRGSDLKAAGISFPPRSER
jgi:hypothetical protein